MPAHEFIYLGIDEHCRFIVLCFFFLFSDAGPDQTHLITAAATLQHTVSFLFTRAHL
jgi:hypothetical protein